MNYKHKIQIMRVLFRIIKQDVFKIGRCTFHIDEDSVFLYYKQNGKDIYSIEIKYSEKQKIEVVYLIQEFMLNAYYSHEWDGSEIKAPTLSKVLGLSQKSTTDLISGISKKIKKHIKKVGGSKEEYFKGFYKD